MNGVSWREAFVLVGVVCVIAGLLLRNLHSDVRGLGLALIIVGVMLFVAGPVGTMLGYW
jgi:hypothetical protein